MPAIGITGGISTGKSTFSRLLKHIVPEAAFFDADAAARQLTAGNVEVRQAIETLFGKEIYSPGGDLNRTEVRAIILRSPAKRRALEQILHPRIRSQWSAQAQKYRNCPEFFFADIPLLYETGGEILCDRVVVVASSAEVQLRRLVNRSMEGRATSRSSPQSPAPAGPAGLSMSESEALELIGTQMSLEEKINRADHVVWNNAGQQILAEQAKSLVNLWRTITWIKM